MKTGGNLFHTTLASKMTSAEATKAAKATFTPPATIQRTSPWHSPIPYLFGGLAAMLGLIAFALLILACSYWKLTGVDQDGGERDVESGEAEKGDGSSNTKALPVFEEKFLVIMAGDVKPTFLATPRIIMSTNAPPCNCGDQEADDGKENVDDQEEDVKQRDDHRQMVSDNVQPSQGNGELATDQSRANHERSH